MTADVRVRRMGPLPQVIVRADPAAGPSLARLGAALGVAPPTTPNTVSVAGVGVVAVSGAGVVAGAVAESGAIVGTEAAEGADRLHVLWLGPDEWLVVGPEGAGPDVAPAAEAAIRVAADGAFVTTVDVSANRVALEVTGTDARRLLAFGCALDLDARHFGPGSCAQTMVARAGVILWALGEEPAPAFRLLVRPSFATYLESWLRDAEVGLD